MPGKQTLVGLNSINQYSNSIAGEYCRTLEKRGEWQIKCNESYKVAAVGAAAFGGTDLSLLEAFAISFQACTFGALAALITPIEVDDMVLVVVFKSIEAILAFTVDGADLPSGETITVA